MTKLDLSKKLKIILKELNMNKKEFIQECQKINNSISKPTILNAINGKTKGFPKLETIDTIIKVCKYSNNEKLKNISYNYLLNEYISNITDENIKINDKTKLSDNAIKILSNLQYPENDMPSNLIEKMDYEFWIYLKFMEQTKMYKRLISKILNYIYNNENKKVKNINELYICFKKEELLQIKETLSNDQYKLYLIKELSNLEIFNDQEIIELEENLIISYNQFSKKLFSDIYKYVTSKTLSNKSFFKAEELDKFIIYLQKNYKCDNYLCDFLNTYKELFKELEYMSIFYKTFLKENFSTQYNYLKLLNTYYKNLEIYKKKCIDLDEDNYIKLKNDLLKSYKLMSVFDEFLKMTINNKMINFYDKL